MQVEANPMSAIGGHLTSSRSSVTSNISRICEEGTIFDIYSGLKNQDKFLSILFPIFMPHFSMRLDKHS